MEALNQLQEVLVAELTAALLLEAQVQLTRVLTAVVAQATDPTPTGYGLVVVAAVPAQLARMQDPRAEMHLVVQAEQELQTALQELQRVTPVAAEVGTQAKQQMLARSKVENVAPPWWAAQVHAVPTQLQVPSIRVLEVAAADSTELHSTTPVVLEAPALLSCATCFPP